MAADTRRTIQKLQFGDKKTEQTKRKALEALKSGGGRQDAARAVGVHPKTLKSWRRRDVQFAEDWDLRTSDARLASDKTAAVTDKYNAGMR